MSLKCPYVHFPICLGVVNCYFFHLLALHCVSSHSVSLVLCVRVLSGSSTGWVYVHKTVSGHCVTSVALHTAVADLCISADAGKIVAR